jgi:hypothetical protein
MRRALAAAFVTLAAASAKAGDAPSADAIRRAAHDVLSRPEFHRRPGRQRTLLEQIWGWWSDVVGEFQQRHPLATIVILGVLFLAVVVLVAHIVWTLRAARRASWQELPDADLAAAMRRGDAAAFRARAVAHADAGRFEAAVRDLYAALLLVLDRQGALHFAPHKALLDYRIEAARDAAATRTLEQFAQTYHPGSFGRRPPDRAHFDELLGALDRVAGRAP